LVFRFDTLETDFQSALESTQSVSPNYVSAADWRAATAWPRIAAQTAAVYRSVA